ncbi:hypothetical protein P9112_012643 [Eukaryota sp. TZLM1-RC]
MTSISITWISFGLAILINVALSFVLISLPNSVGDAIGKKVINEIRRKGFHVNGFCYPSLYYILYRGGVASKSTVVLFSSLFSIAFALFELLRIVFPCFNRFSLKYLSRVMRKKERHDVTALFHFANGALFSVLFFPPAAAIIGMGHVVVGDVAAAITGVAFGKIRIKGKKTLEGTLGCLIACFLSGFVFSSLTLAIPVHCSLVSGLISALFATLAELYADSRLDDNFIMPIAGSLGVVLPIKVLLGSTSFLYF